MMSVLIGLSIICLSVICDHVTKVLALAYLQDKPLIIIKNFFRLELTYNDGAAFSSFAGNFAFLMGMTLIAVVIFIILARKADFHKKKFYSTGVYLMIGGMLGNFFERVFFEGHKVVDFLSFTFFGNDFAIFNIADCCLVVGTIMLLIDVIFLEVRRERKEFNA